MAEFSEPTEFSDPSGASISFDPDQGIAQFNPAPDTFEAASGADEPDLPQITDQTAAWPVPLQAPPPPDTSYQPAPPPPTSPVPASTYNLVETATRPPASAPPPPSPLPAPSSAPRIPTRDTYALALRERIVSNARWGITNEPPIHYSNLRPVDGLTTPYKLPLYTDCSGWAILCYAWAGAPDPNDLGYNGQSSVETLLNHMKHIGIAAAQPGDLVAFGPAPGHHVAIVLEAGPDPLLCSHGQEKGPIAIRFSVESRFQPAPATWLSSLP